MLIVLLFGKREDTMTERITKEINLINFICTICKKEIVTSEDNEKELTKVNCCDKPNYRPYEIEILGNDGKKRWMDYGKYSSLKRAGHIKVNDGGEEILYGFLESEETKLKDEVLTKLAQRERSKASELITKQIKKENHILTTRDDIKSEMWIYREGIYISQGKTYVKEFCRKILGHAYTSQFVNEVIGKIEVDTFIEQDDFFKNEYPTQIPLQNGILNIITKKISLFSPKKIFFNKLPVVYDPSKRCPKITKHFETVLKDKSDAEVMFELIGYCLLKDSILEKAFMFSGDGRNGKSKTLELIKKFLGVENCSSLGLEQLKDNSFEIHELFGKMVNLRGDLSYHGLRETGMLKMLIGRDSISAKRKFLRTLFFVNHAKLIFACNELPKIYDMTDGFWTKWIFLEFPYKFITQEEFDKLPDKEKENKKILNPEIIKELTTPDELSGLLNKALESLNNILKKKDFSDSKGTKETKDLWIRKSDSFTAFCLDKIEDSQDGRISKKELRRAYKKYCKEHKAKGIRIASDQSIKITLEQMFGAYDSQEHSSERYWEGIELKGEVGSSNRGNTPYDFVQEPPIL